MIDSQREAVKRPRLQEKHTKITRQQQCHKIQGLVLSVRIRERREPGASCVEESDEVCAAVCGACLCVCVGRRRDSGEKNLDSASKKKIPFMCDWGCATVSSLSPRTGWVSRSLRWLAL